MVFGTTVVIFFFQLFIFYGNKRELVRPISRELDKRHVASGNISSRKHAAHKMDKFHWLELSQKSLLVPSTLNITLKQNYISFFDKIGNVHNYLTYDLTSHFQTK